MIAGLFEGLHLTMRDVAYALTPLVIAFICFQLFMLKLPKRQIIKIAKGIVMTYFGLVLFLQGVNIGFMPAGDSLGMALGDLDYNWILVPIGFILGFAVIMAEPTVMVLVDQVEEASSGHINRKIMLYTLCIGVAVAVALAMVRVLLGISIWYFIVPGYIIALVLSKFSSPDFVAIAFDSGAAATGPMTVTFILAMTVGVAKQIPGRNPLMDGFGLVCLVALAPTLAILILGFIYRRKEAKMNE